jgi:hypothetical protein
VRVLGALIKRCWRDTTTSVLPWPWGQVFSVRRNGESWLGNGFMIQGDKPGPDVQSRDQVADC